MADSESAAMPATSLDPGLRVRLSLMMFLQYAVWGAWWSVMVLYMGAQGFSNLEVARAYATTAVASIISPLIFGQLADRWVPTQYLLGGLHLVGAVLLVAVTRMETFGAFYVCVLLWALLYIPTISLTNSLSFQHVPDAGRFFPGIRVFGTIGWIVVGIFVGNLLDEKSSQPILLAAVLSVALGAYCFTLPHTPPRGGKGEAFPAIKALGMLRDGQFALFIFVSFLIATLLAAYFSFTASYLSAPPRNFASAADKMVIGQVAEMILLPMLPLMLRTLGMKWTLILGMAAWGVRYGIFAVGQPNTLILAAIALHGICYDFFFVAAYIHVDSQARPEIRASAQALFNLVVMGLGMLIGNELFGRLVQRFTTTVGEGAEAVSQVDWTTVWTYPAVGALVPVLLFALFFRPKRTSA